MHSAIIVISALVIAVIACVAAAVAVVRLRRASRALRSLEERVEELSDRNWELRDSDERSRSLLQAQGDLIVRRDPAGNITYANEAFARLVAADREIIGTDFAPRVVAQRKPVLLPDGTRVRDEAIEDPQGARWISWREVTVRDPRTEATETQSVGRDITAHMEAELALAEARDQAEAASRAKSRFLAAMSHEIRTPLNGILGMADLLLDTPLTPEQATYATAVRSSGRSLLTLVEDVLDFSTIEAGKLVFTPQPFALACLVEETVELLAPRAYEKSLEIASYVDDALPGRVVGDPARLRQVLFNLAGNAVKFTQRGGLSIQVTAEADEHVRFVVEDSGIGIAADALARIFDEFEQAQGADMPRPGGAGLGLAISRRIVEHMGGSLTVESEPGSGSRFSFCVRLPAGSSASENATAPPDLAPLNVLIAGSPVTGAVIARRLRTWGARAEVVLDAAHAEAALRRDRFDALLADCSLGEEGLRTVAGADADCKRIVLLASAQRAEIPKFAALGYARYLIKPVRAASLAAMLSAAEPGGGAGVTPPAQAAGAEVKPAARTHAGPALSILVAEDNEINALLIRTLLDKMGHRATLVDNGIAAVAQWRQAHAIGRPFDAILMDVQMPELDGPEATRRIRADEDAEGLARTPIIALSANAFPEDRDACHAAGMNGFLVKPLAREELAALLAAGAARASLAA